LANEEIADRLVEKIHHEMQQLTVGSPEDNAVVTPLINEKAADFVQVLIDDALARGAKLIAGNKREKHLIYPTLLDNVTTDMDIAWEEPFGPVLPIIRIQSEKEAIQIANRSE